MTLRSTVFFTISRINNNNVIKHLKDLKIDQSAIKNTYKLSQLLNFVSENSPYYKKYRGYDTIRDFPIIDKKLIKKNYNSLATFQFDEEKNHIMSTSGSSGVPFKIHQNQDKRNRVIAEVIYYNSLANYALGERLLYLKNFGKKESYYKNKFIKNIINLDVKNLNDKELYKIYKKLNNTKKANILGYASALEKLGIFIARNNLSMKKNSIKSIISTSELLTDKNKRIWHDLTGLNVVSRYANQENGLLAQSSDEIDGYILNHSSYYFEFLKLDSDDYANPGERARIVITDLYSKAIPMIRYDTGDIGTYNISPQGEVFLSSIEGRLRDYILTVSGDLLSPSIITKMMWEFYYLDGFQFIQKDKEKYILKIIDSSNRYDESRFLSKLKIYLGESAQIKIEKVSEIEKLSSGKVQLVKNEYISL